MNELLRTFDLHHTSVDDMIRAIRAQLGTDALLVGQSVALRTVTEVFEDVRTGGDAAVRRFTRQFDGVDLEPRGFRVSDSELQSAHASLPAALLEAIRLARDNLLAFQRHILPQESWLTRDGARLGLRAIPLESAACMVPGASAPLPSSVLHTVVCAQAAGVPRIVVFSPPRYQESIHPVILGTACELGVTEVYRIGGAQAVAAAAMGTASIPRVAKIVGPGSVYVALAKKLAFGLVDIDSFAGPSEVLIIADDSADPSHVAADMIAQAEHDPGAAVLVTWSPALAEAVLTALDAQLIELPREAGTRRCLQQHSAIVHVADVDQAVLFANAFAAEHLEVNCLEAAELAKRLTTAGAVFVGPHTPEAVGDYLAGPSHVLPTGGTARFFSGLSSLSFLRRQSVIEFDARALHQAGDAVVTLAEAEELIGHARSVSRRLSTTG